MERKKKKKKNYKVQRVKKLMALITREKTNNKKNCSNGAFKNKETH
jgi:hypothetical protein